jgi:hypothetical protein
MKKMFTGILSLFILMAIAKVLIAQPTLEPVTVLNAQASGEAILNAAVSEGEDMEAAMGNMEVEDVVDINMEMPAEAAY